MVRDVPPELGMLFESPEYAATMFAPPAPVAEMMTWHVAPTPSVHIAGAVRREVLPLPPTPPWVNVIVPVAPPAGYPVTVAVQVLDEPTITVEGAQPTLTILVTWLTVNMKLSIAVAMVESVAVIVTVNGDPIVEFGVQLIEFELELLHPGGSPVHE